MDLTFEGVHFNISVIQKMETVEELLTNVSYRHLWPKLKPADRKKRLRELYKLVKAKK